MKSNTRMENHQHTRRVLATLAELHLVAREVLGTEYDSALRALSDMVNHNKKLIECCICGRVIFVQLSCNPDPVSFSLSDRCCRDCDVKVVIPARARQRYSQEKVQR